MLLEELKKENMMALKEGNKDKRAALSIVLGKVVIMNTDIAIINKGGITDEDIIKVIAKTLKELEEEKNDYLKVGNAERAVVIDKQIASLQIYLPKMLSNDEIKCIILSLEDKSVPNVMKHFKLNYPGKVDMSLVSKVLKEIA
ncbi:MAG: GatB/YqeY domain-containing protein [Bacilli bacterium]